MLDFEETQKLIAESEERAKTDRIELDTPLANELGFTSDKFDGYLWKHGRFITVSFIMSKDEGKGNLSRLFKSINEHGYKIEVPTPFPNMELILKCHGFKKTLVCDPLMGEVEVWQQQRRIWQVDREAVRRMMVDLHKEAVFVQKNRVTKE